MGLGLFIGGLQASPIPLSPPFYGNNGDKEASQRGYTRGFDRKVRITGITLSGREKRALQIVGLLVQQCFL